MNAKYYPLIKLARQVSLMKRRVTLPFKLLSSGFLRSESYFPEMPQKSKLKIASELLDHIMRFGSIEWHYFSYGFDIKGLRNRNDYLDDNWFLWKSSMMNTVLPERDNSCILRDKRLFSDFLSIWGFDTPKVMGELNGTNLDLSVLEYLLSKDGEYFLKPLDGACGRGVFEVRVLGGECSVSNVRTNREKFVCLLSEHIQDGVYLIQEKVRQHAMLNEIYDKSINTIRLVTVYDKMKDIVVPLSAVLRIGANGNVVDNWAAGGLAVGIDLDSGALRDYGFYKHGKGTKTLTHPNSGKSFKDVTIPFWNDLKEKALDLHHHLLPLSIIGWDIAITPNGPLFIEGNDNMEISINQEADKGLKKELLSLISQK